MTKVDSAIQEIVFIVTINEALEKKQNFSQIKNAFIKIYNQNNNGINFIYVDLEKQVGCISIRGNFHLNIRIWEKGYVLKWKRRFECMLVPIPFLYKDALKSAHAGGLRNCCPSLLGCG